MNSPNSPQEYKNYSQIRQEILKTLTNKKQKQPPKGKTRKNPISPFFSPQNPLVEAHRINNKLKIKINYPPTPWKAPKIKYEKGKTRGYKPHDSRESLFVEAIVPHLRLLKTQVKDWPQKAPYELWALFFVPQPQKKPKTQHYPITRPDLVNYTKLLEDCLQGNKGAGLIPDDNLIVRHVVEKVYAPPQSPGYVIIAIGPLEEETKTLKEITEFLEFP